MDYTRAHNSETMWAILQALGLENAKITDLTLHMPVRGPLKVAITSVVPLELDAKLAKAIEAGLISITEARTMNEASPD